MNISVAQVISLLIAFAPILTPVGLALYQVIVSRVQPAMKQHPILMQLVQSVVQGVEQQFEGSTGAEKKQAALNELVLLCKHYGISIDSGSLSALIEAYVYQLHTQPPASNG